MAYTDLPGTPKPSAFTILGFIVVFALFAWFFVLLFFSTKVSAGYAWILIDQYGKD